MEWCPIHGTYTPPRAWLDLRRRAVSGREKPVRAMAMLEAAARLRRRCRHGPHQCPTGPKWAEQIRFKIEQGSGMRDGKITS